MSLKESIQTVYAKVNLSLLITASDSELHRLDMVVVSVNQIADTITLTERSDRAIAFSCSNGLLFENNTAVKAARLFQTAFHTNGVDIHVKKGIPMRAGLGGSSADAAGVLLGMQQLYQKQPKMDIEAIATEVGSDVMYMLSGGCARVTGQGDRIEHFAMRQPLHLVIAKPMGGVDTKAAFQTSDQINLCYQGDNAKLIANLYKGNYQSLQQFMVNDLYQASCTLNSDIAPLADTMLKTDPVAVVMSGSGSSLVALYQTQDQATKAEVYLKDKAEFVAYCTTR